MKKIFTVLVSLLFIGSIFGAEVLKKTYDFVGDAWNFPSEYVQDEGTYTNGIDSVVLQSPTKNGYKYRIENRAGGIKDTVSLLIGKNNATLKFTPFDWQTTKIVIYGVEGASAKVTFNIFVDSEPVSTMATSSLVDNEFEIDDNYQAAGNVYVFKITNSNNAQISKIEIYGIEETPTTDIENTKSTEESTKIFKDSQILIKRNNHTYTITGVKIQ